MKTDLQKKLMCTLETLLYENTLDKITVTAIVDKCGISRQTFYYYFSDIYDIVEWFFEQETRDIIENNSELCNWKTGYAMTLNWVKEHKIIISNTYRAVGREYVEYYMNRVLHPYILRMVEKQACGLMVFVTQKEFITSFFTSAINHVTIEWVRNDMKEEPEKLAEKIGVLVQGDIKKALRSFQYENQKSNIITKG